MPATPPAQFWATAHCLLGSLLFLCTIATSLLHPDYKVKSTTAVLVVTFLLHLYLHRAEHPGNDAALSQMAKDSATAQPAIPTKPFTAAQATSTRSPNNREASAFGFQRPRAGDTNQTILARKWGRLQLKTKQEDYVAWRTQQDMKKKEKIGPRKKTGFMSLADKNAAWVANEASKVDWVRFEAQARKGKTGEEWISR